MNKQTIKRIEKDPMGDDDIRYYFPNAKIIEYNELNKYSDINQFLKLPTDYAFILYEESQNSGHWVLLSKYANTIEYFDPYGGYPDTPLTWVPMPQRHLLGQGSPKLSQLFDNTHFDTVYNPIDYQNKKDKEMSTCGRHCCFRLLCLLKLDMNLENYYHYMINLKKKTKKTFDEIVSENISKV
jgi:hypothetical protein